MRLSFCVLLRGGVKQIKRLLRHRVRFVDLRSWMLAGETFVRLLSVGHVTPCRPVAASQHRLHLSHVFVAAFSRSFLQFYLNVIFLWFSYNIQHAWFYSRRSVWWYENTFFTHPHRQIQHLVIHEKCYLWVKFELDNFKWVSSKHPKEKVSLVRVSSPVCLRLFQMWLLIPTSC